MEILKILCYYKKMGNKIKKELQGKKPLKKMGQNFLLNNFAIKKIVETAKIKRNETVLEVGPGTGILTEELLKTGGKIIAVEKDKQLCSLLIKKFKGIKNIEIVEEDILEFNIDFLPQNYKVVANIPYYITSFFIRRFLESKNKPKKMVLTIQKEVANRICSNPPNMSLLSVSVQYYAKPRLIMKISKNSFWPKPKVDSAIVEITPFLLPKEEKTDYFFKVVRAGFSQPRKQIINNLSKELNVPKDKIIELLLKNGFSPKKRPGDFSIEDWMKLTNCFNLNNSLLL
ncbi:MAG: 16S rRNA (adenine(1518)-N(6)/adenine(1519)-N(6))-dimethyltransferase RsmA [Candidatus Pacebacteria bacterium]|nr:16S rRNA (adenine(1518)-N(6)/adenine(1519)-N(6))-dimethyltransferase RsmA [Candidatus Paceibacterota bacterium]